MCLVQNLIFLLFAQRNVFLNRQVVPNNSKIIDYRCELGIFPEYLTVLFTVLKLTLPLLAVADRPP